MALIGLALEYPAVAYDSVGLVTYTAGTQSFDCDAAPLAIRFSPADLPIAITPPRDLQLHITVDNTGTLAGGVPGDDLLIQGDIDVDGDTVPEYSGTLLTGEVEQFGFLDSLDTDQYEFRFKPTGGQLLSYFAGKDIGLRMTSVNSTFSDSFTADFWGGAQGILGPVEPPETQHPPASIFGCVYVDKNKNGIEDNGEPPIQGVKVILKDSNGNPIKETFTDANGMWSFDDLLSGTYTVCEVQPPGYGDGQESLNGIAIPGTIGTDAITVTLAEGQNAGEYCFGEIPGRIFGCVYVDKCRNGVEDPGDPPISGVKFILKDSNGNPIAETFSDASGTWSFGCLTAGTYTVCEVQPAEYADGQESLNGTAIPHTVGTDSIVVTLAAGQNAGEYCFGERCGAICGAVYLDKCKNGIYDSSEPGIQGVLITLKDNAGNTVATTITDCSGLYSFDCLKAGTYKIYETQPAGYRDGSESFNRIVFPGTLGTDVIIVNLAPGQTTGQYNFGELLGCLSGYAYVDYDNDGGFDSNDGDERLSGVKIGLKDQAGKLIATTYTNSSGYYEFECLAGKTYTLCQIAQLSGLIYGKTTPGKINGVTCGTAAAPDKITGIVLPSGVCGFNYDFVATPSCRTVTKGNTASWQFWCGSQGQALIKCLNGSASSTKLGDWLASNFKNMYGSTCGSMNCAKKTNTYIAGLCASVCSGNTIDSQALALALSLYVTNSKLAGTVATQYGFKCSSSGIGGKYMDVARCGAVFGCSNYHTRTVLQLLKYCDSKAVKGVCYGGEVNSQRAACRVFNACNQTGDIGPVC